MSLASFSKLLVSLSLFACASVFAAPLVVNVAGIQSQGEIGDSGNTVLTYNVGANSVITSVAYSFNLTAFSPSWLTEIGLAFTDSDSLDGVAFNPGLGNNSPGTASYAGFGDLVDLGLDFAVGADGILRLEFYEDFDDFAGVDGVWNFGTITFGIEPVNVEVPEPASGLLLGAGLAMMGYANRRRQAARKAARAA
ncbi:PEP-CTERM sorting domain-containing protein [Oxalobacteraceae sp. CFBP 13708]|nr:PEP-CTERM sorting domain-containing protein [Oxalobacteraceae sp. CFBP 13708]